MVGIFLRILKLPSHFVKVGPGSSHKWTYKETLFPQLHNFMFGHSQVGPVSKLHKMFPGIFQRTLKGPGL